MMLEVFDLSRTRRAVLQNAFGVRYGGGELYRILPASAVSDAQGESITYTCEHVLATLMDHVLFGFHQVGNRGIYTADCIRYVLDRQKTRNWVLDGCDFARQFEYGWEQENLLGALLSIPKPFTEPYRWVTDTSAHPWRLSLRRIDTGRVPEMYIRRGKNMLALQKDTLPAQICTRLYPLGYGEGVNQLTIASVNGGVPYLQSPPEIVAKYGVIERVWIDRRYENAESLKAAAQAMLGELQQPRTEYSVSFAQLGQADLDQAQVGKIVEIVDPDLGVRERSYITGMTLSHGDLLSSELTVANTPVDVARTVADLADRQRIEMTYAQGATQLYAQSVQVNASPSDGAALKFWIPAEMRIVNKVLVKISVERFRTYSRTSSSNGGHNTTLSTRTHSQHVRLDSETETINIEEQEFSYWAFDGFDLWGETEPAGSTSKNHTHEFQVSSEDGLKIMEWITIPGQRVRFRVPSSSFDVTIPGQSISLSIPSHSHEITPGIFRYGNPRGFTLLVDGRQRAVLNTTSAEVDLTGYLAAGGSISRGVWHSVEIRPDDLAYVCVDMFVQGFVQSRGDATV